MYETLNDLSPSIRERMIELLNARLADAIDLRTQLKVAHWNVKGPQFIALHKLFDEIVDDADEYVDLVAERAVQLGGVADGTARQVAERSTLDEYAATGGGNGQEHVDAVADALGQFGRSARQAIEIAASAKDQDTSDIFTEISRGTDKWLWMVEAHRQTGEWVRPSSGDRGEAGRDAAH
ncbi:DNA starvation/stationary phase protection protein Dps [Anaeromyxobacter oryzae]|uniref:DNA starvation/stationary phase protection protein n=1 Tax=Anaeromyxobacter oryzae TaxID=2918170 RepID=A0ABM7WZW2_9BACT|nr:DNA starvation/stationary phase protection protein Dps [Anaeromyxobacter oryzae]BDG05084.1 DNA starvation/stationary phase protection protein [Anaeromyxobacter oryzae]